MGVCRSKTREGLQRPEETIHGRPTSLHDWLYTVFYRIHAPPQIDAPPNFWIVPEDSSLKIYMTTLFNDQFNSVSMICLLHLMKYPNVYEKQRSFTAYYSYRSKTTSGHFISVS